MKALLAVDIPDELFKYYKNFYVNYDLRAERKNALINESVKYVEGSPLKPLPSRNPQRDIDKAFKLGNNWLAHAMEGFNGCLDRILEGFDSKEKKMDKVFFVMNKPKSCEECPRCNYSKDELEDEGDGYDFRETYTCNLTGKEVNRDLSKSCPLKPLPKEEEIPIDAEIMYSWYLKGYNECLRLLVGEEE